MIADFAHNLGSRPPHVEPILNQMVELGFRIEPELMGAALRLINE